MWVRLSTCLICASFVNSIARYPISPNSLSQLRAKESFKPMLIYFTYCKLTAAWLFHITPSGMRNVSIGKHAGPVSYLWLSRVNNSDNNEEFIKITQFPFQGEAAIGVCLLSTGICNYCGQYCQIDVLLEVRHLLASCMDTQINTAAKRVCYLFDAFIIDTGQWRPAGIYWCQ